MTVPPLGAGPARGDLRAAIAPLEALQPQLLAALGSTAQPGDSVAERLQRLSDSTVGELLRILDRPLSADASAHTAALLESAIRAVAGGRLERAMVHLAEFAAADPRQAGQLESLPELASVRPQISQLLSRLAAAARLEAESRLAAATRQLEDAERPTPAAAGLTPRLALELAARLLQAGGYPNCALSAQFSSLALSLYTAPVPVATEPSPPAARRPAPATPLHHDGPAGVWAARLRHLWRRGPLLVLLLGWLALGLTVSALAALGGWLAAEHSPGHLPDWLWTLWALGFLVLVLFGFFVRLWRRRR